MNRLLKTFLYFSATTLAFGASVGYLSAQEAAASSAQQQPVLRVTDQTRLKTRNNWCQETPTDFAGSRRREWGVFDVQFDVFPAWIDELTVVYTVMAENKKPVTKEDAQQPFSLYTLTTRYSSIEKGKGHKVSAVLLPGALKRYGEPVGLHVEFIVAGQTIATADDSAAAFLDPNKQWWNNPQITGNAKVTKRDGQLQDRSKTPFGLVRVDEYEIGKQ